MTIHLATTPAWGPRFSAHKNGVDQAAIATNVWTLLTWSTEIYDSHNAFAANRFTPGIIGKYSLTAAGLWGASVDQSETGIAIYKNGVSYKTVTIISSGTGNQGPLIQVDADVTAAADYFEVFARQITGANQTINGNAAASYFMGHYIGS